MIETPYAKVKDGKITKEIVYLNALEEENFRIAHAATPFDTDSGAITVDEVEVRQNGKPALAGKKVDYIDVATTRLSRLPPPLSRF